MCLTILSVAFPMSPVGLSSSGGAEQILSEIDRGLVVRGHTSIVIACPGSRVAGTLIPTWTIAGPICTAQWMQANDAVRKAIAFALQRHRPDLAHMHGLYFSDYLPQEDLPVLVTLHLPISSYKSADLRPARPRTHLHCVSHSQHQTAPASLQLLPDIENGVRTDLLRPPNHVCKKDFVICLGRICPEKGFHFAIDAAKKAKLGMVLAGQIFPFPEHQRYFDQQIQPALDLKRCYIGPLALPQKCRLLSAARCAIVPSLVEETSSLVAREALSCGTPVVAFRRGALPEIIDHGKTGFLVERPDELPDAIHACRSLDPGECRRAAVERFDANKMIERYIGTYRQILEISGPLAQQA